jgi:hypothetical protein
MSKSELKPVSGLSQGDRISSNGCVVEVMEKPYISTTDDLFGREMLVFLAKIIEGEGRGPGGVPRKPGDSGKLIYGPHADAVVLKKV